MVSDMIGIRQSQVLSRLEPLEPVKSWYGPWEPINEFSVFENISLNPQKKNIKPEPDHSLGEKII